MASVIWKDKKPVLLLSTHAIPIDYLCMPLSTVPRRVGTIQKDIMASLMHLEYTTHKRGVDVTNHLQAFYSTQNCIHKWWHKVLFVLLDMTVVNIFIIYLAECKRWSKLLVSCSHLQFMVNLCEAPL